VALDLPLQRRSILFCLKSWRYLGRSLLASMLMSHFAKSVLVASVLGASVGYNASDESTVSFACLPTSCLDAWEGYGGEVVLPCSVASGHLHGGIAPFSLPLLYEGNYDLCSTFRMAHFCTISSTGIVITPTLDRHLRLSGAMPLGFFRLDQCVSQDCDLPALQSSFNRQVWKFVKEALSVLRVDEATKEEIDKELKLLLGALRITCVDEQNVKLDAAGTSTVVVLSIFFVAVLFSTLTSWCAPNLRISSRRAIQFFDAKYNSSRLVAAIPGDFNAFNGIRVLSMCWVIIGHGFLLYLLPVYNPTAEGRVLQSFPFAYLRGAEFAVDTFFFLSGFLATWGIANQLSQRQLTTKTFLMLLVGRYLRLTPTYLVVIMLYWKVLPALATGPFWHDVTALAAQQCSQDSNFVYNLLYLNNLLPKGKFSPCLGWSWYLANDFQFFLLVPIIVDVFLRGRRVSNKFLSFMAKYGLSIALIVQQVIVTFIIVLDIGTSNSPRFQTEVYIRPWCRVTPYAVGIILAFIHYERVSDTPESGWKTVPLTRRGVYAIHLSAIAALFLLIAVLFQQYRCKEDDHQCDIYLSMYRYGFFTSANWGKYTTAFYYSLDYLLWSMPLAMFSYVLFLEDFYDLLGLKAFLSWEVFTPLARLTYNAYLVHLPIMQIKIGLQKMSPTWESFRICLEVVAYIVLAYALSFFLYLLVEKPVMNGVSALFARLKTGPKERVVTADDNEESMDENDQREDHYGILERQYSEVSDLDSETVHLSTWPRNHGEEAAGGAYTQINTS